MRDWNAHALAHLSSLRVAPARKSELALELGAHLEEFYADLRSRGMPEEQAYLETCAQAGNWRELCDEIFASTKEVTMLDRIKQIWVPAAVTFVFAYAALMCLEVYMNRGYLTHTSKPRGLAFFLPWFLLLPFIGAASGYISRHAKGEGWRVYLAASFPALVIAGVFLAYYVLFVAAGPQRPTANPAAFVWMLFAWAILPGLILCSGAALQGLLAKRTNIA